MAAIKKKYIWIKRSIGEGQTFTLFVSYSNVRVVLQLLRAIDDSIQGFELTKLTRYDFTISRKGKGGRKSVDDRKRGEG